VPSRLPKNQEHTASHARRLAIVVAACFVLGNMAGVTQARSDQKALIAVFPEHFPPIFETTRNDVPVGFGIEVMEEIAARAGLNIRYRALPGWLATHTALQTGKADLIPNMGITPKRRQMFDFSVPLMRMSVSLYVRAGLPEIDGLRDLVAQNRSIAIVESNVSADLVSEYLDIPQKTYRSVSEALFAMQAGEVDALVYPTPVVDKLVLRLELGNSIRPGRRATGGDRARHRGTQGQSGAARPAQPGDYRIRELAAISRVL
jgi:ABC-type amino acid transport substrate-binding protein